MTDNSMTKGKYSKIEKENGLNIKHRTSVLHTKGREVDAIQFLSSKRDTYCSH